MALWFDGFLIDGVYLPSLVIAVMWPPKAISFHYLPFWKDFDIYQG